MVQSSNNIQKKLAQNSLNLANQAAEEQEPLQPFYFLNTLIYSKDRPF